MLRLAVAILCGMGTASIGTTAISQPSLRCGTTYTVQRGDTLFKIAERAYGDGWKYEQIFVANRDLLPDEGSLEVGNELRIPCLAGAGTPARGTVASRGRVETPAAHDEGPVEPVSPPAKTTKQVRTASSVLLDRVSQMARSALLPGSSLVGTLAVEAEPLRSAERSVEILEAPEPGVTPATSPSPTVSRETDSGADYAALGQVDASADVGANPERGVETLNLVTVSNLPPFAGADLPNGGMVTELVKRSLKAAAPTQSFRLSFVDNRAEDLTRLSRNGTFDVSFPWFKPDCGRGDKLDQRMRLLCDRFEFSRPIIEVHVGFYVRAGDALLDADDPSALHGKRLCWPQEHIAFDLDLKGVRASDVSIETSTTGLACFVKLLQGKVDVVTHTRRDAEEQIRHLDVDGQVSEVGGLASKPTLHAIVSKSNPRAQRYLELIDRGLSQVMKSGEWFNVVLAHNRR